MRWMLLLAASLAMAGCGSLSGERSAASATPTPACVRADVTLVITGMDCPACSEMVDVKLESLDGVIEAAVTLSPPEAAVGYCPDRVTTQQMIDAIADLGYGASVQG